MTALASETAPARTGPSAPALCATAAGLLVLAVPVLPVGCSEAMSDVACGLALVGLLLGLGLGGWALGGMIEARLTPSVAPARRGRWLALGFLLALLQVGSLAVGVMTRPMCNDRMDALARLVSQVMEADPFP